MSSSKFKTEYRTFPCLLKKAPDFLISVSFNSVHIKELTAAISTGVLPLMKVTL